jgi:chromosome partitioning protein
MNISSEQHMSVGDVDWDALTRVIAVINGKGGVGKTSTCACLACLAAAAGYRTLVVDMDVQGNIAEEYGISESDDGLSMLTALMTGQPPTVVENVRANLDVICGGRMLRQVDTALSAVADQYGALAGQLRIAQILAPLAKGYDLVVIDCPPNKRGVAILSAARFVLAPTKSDKSSVKGLSFLAADFVEARQVNTGLELLGVVLFGSSKSATKITAGTRAKVGAALQGAAPIMDTVIRHAESVAVEVRDRGLLPHELERSELDLAQLRGRKARTGSRSSLAGDYQDLVAEVLAAFNARIEQIEQAA